MSSAVVRFILVCGVELAVALIFNTEKDKKSRRLAKELVPLAASFFRK
jgi:hypothetical protein